jgi:hypothetical protein
VRLRRRRSPPPTRQHITITAITASSIATVAIGAAMAIIGIHIDIHTATITAIVHFFFLKAKK